MRHAAFRRHIWSLYRSRAATRLTAVAQPLLVSLNVILALVPSGNCLGQTFWTDGTGNWNTPANWTLGVPNSGSTTAFDAIIENGGTAQLLAAPAGSVRRLRIGRAAGAGNVLVDAANLTATESLYINEVTVE